MFWIDENLKTRNNNSYRPLSTTHDFQVRPVFNSITRDQRCVTMYYDVIWQSEHKYPSQ